MHREVGLEECVSVVMCGVCVCVCVCACACVLLPYSSNTNPAPLSSENEALLTTLGTTGLAKEGSS